MVAGVVRNSDGEGKSKDATSSLELAVVEKGKCVPQPSGMPAKAPGQTGWELLLPSQPQLPLA